MKVLNKACRLLFIAIFVLTWLFSAWPMNLRFPLEKHTAEAGGWYASGWPYRKKITIDTTKVAGSATSFPVLVNRTDADWKSADWGGHMGTATAADVLFTLEDGTTKLDHELEKFASTTGELVAWVRYPFLSSTSTNAMYVYYGNSSQEDQQNRTGVWENSFKGVWHLSTTSTLDVRDSTSYADDGSNIGASATQGNVDGGGGFVRAQSDYVSISQNGNFNLSGSSFTVSLWVQEDTTDFQSTYKRFVFLVRRIKECSGWSCI